MYYLYAKERPWLVTEVKIMDFGSGFEESQTKYGLEIEEEKNEDCMANLNEGPCVFLSSFDSKQEE